VDRNAVEKLEAILKRSGRYDRNETFEKLMAAKSDVSSLTSEEILRKDAKVVAVDDVPSVVVAAFPLAVEVR
jgi:inorganic pyrophosphatase/exopolyphosphatase